MADERRCPCCGALIDCSELRWLPMVGLLLGPNGTAIRLSPLEARLFTLLWNSSQPIPRQKLIHVIYGQRRDGGPLTASHVVRVYIWRIRKKIAAAKLRIVGRDDILLVRTLTESGRSTADTPS